MKAFFIFLFPVTLQAQSNTVTTGGTATGTTGSSTFSIGQVVYHVSGDNSFSYAEGVQQPFEIIPLATDDIKATDVNLKIYPNPTFSGFNIVLPYDEILGQTYQLSDISGKIVRKGEISTMNTFVTTDGLNSGVYLLKTSTSSKTYRTYKIIKK